MKEAAGRWAEKNPGYLIVLPVGWSTTFGLKFAFKRQTTLMQKLIIILIGMVMGLSSSAQLQIGVFGGIANYQGDLVDKIYQKPKAAGGLEVGYQISSRINLRAGLSFAKVQGADSLSDDPVLKGRNLSFQTPITEFSVVGEFNTFDLDVKRWSPYVFAGLAVFHYNPYTYDASGNQAFLQPLSTEGQGIPGYGRKPYSLTQLAIPFGGGVKYNISDRVRIGLELGLRKLFTDYLDDVSGNYADPGDLLAVKGQQSYDLSYRGDETPLGDPNYPPKGAQRGSPKYKDYYYFTGLHLSFLFPDGNGGNRARKGGYGCPSVF